MTSCTEFAKANLLDIVTYELTLFDLIEKYNRLQKMLAHIRADITDLYWLRYVHSHSISIDNHITMDISHILVAAISSKHYEQIALKWRSIHAI
jgi:hypothetical protein